jgi:hypothetical protein
MYYNIIKEKTIKLKGNNGIEVWPIDYGDGRNLSWLFDSNGKLFFLL